MKVDIEKNESASACDGDLYMLAPSLAGRSASESESYRMTVMRKKLDELRDDVRGEKHIALLKTENARLAKEVQALRALVKLGLEQE